MKYIIMKRLPGSAIFTGMLIFTSLGVAWADAGTPLIWASIFHLFLGNFLIGLGEGYLLVWRYRTKASFSVVVMILANYISSWIGFLLIGSIFSSTLEKITGDGGLPLHSHLITELLMLIGLFAITIFIEWPFCYVILRCGSSRKEGALAWRSLKASILLQSASYIMFIAIYVWCRINESGW